MDNLIRFKSHFQLLSVFSLSVLIVGTYYVSVDTVIQDLLPDMVTVLDITKWFRYF